MCVVKNERDEKWPRQFCVNLFVGMQDRYKSRSLGKLISQLKSYHFIWQDCRIKITICVKLTSDTAGCSKLFFSHIHVVWPIVSTLDFQSKISIFKKIQFHWIFCLIVYVVWDLRNLKWAEKRTPRYYQTSENWEHAQVGGGST